MFTETKPLANQAMFGTPPVRMRPSRSRWGKDAATGLPSITVRINNSGTFSDGQRIIGTRHGNDQTDLILGGVFFGNLVYIYVTSGASQQPGVNGTATLRAEPVAPVYNTPACYFVGTLFRTDRGGRAIETLAIGDRVSTAALRQAAAGLAPG